MNDELKLDKKNEKLFNVLRFLIFVIFILGSIYFTYCVLFPSEYFTQSFKNMNSLKNTITDVSKSGNSITFFASTSQDFEEIKIKIELEKNSAPLNKTLLNIKKSYKSFFYPESSSSEQLPALNENLLAASAESIFVVSQDQKNPIDNPLTFMGLGYKWDNIESKKIDLSEHKKKKLLNIASAHPDGTILSTDQNKYYLIDNKLRKEIDASLIEQVKQFKNNILVQEASLEVNDNCQLKNGFILKQQYSCVIPIEKISQFSGKDYRFELFNISENVELKEIHIEFKKTPNKNNLFIFLADIKTKIKARFSGEKL